ncbi:hypothetical protein [Cohnella luojiensis]|uniref:Zinc-ribbon domain-containing protein n=1 Tax=Cohnella luojiensis TaxID=652876 RepID=A0A4Y8LS68_9BACL|nr:hypothetical protein [Cohnella luojiensis]TFE23693.1 hypothetical protein E2980_18660 [Cohnella luojiensis]
MYCTNCGEKLIETAFSCPSCGTEVRQAPLAQESITETSEFPASQEPSFPSQPKGYLKGLSNQSKKLILVGLAAVAVIYLAFKFIGGGGNQATPEKTVKGFMSAVKQEDA